MNTLLQSNHCDFRQGWGGAGYTLTQTKNIYIATTCVNSDLSPNLVVGVSMEQLAQIYLQWDHLCFKTTFCILHTQMIGTWIWSWHLILDSHIFHAVKCQVSWLPHHYHMVQSETSHGVDCSSLIMTWSCEKNIKLLDVGWNFPMTVRCGNFVRIFHIHLSAKKCLEFRVSSIFLLTITHLLSFKFKIYVLWPSEKNFPTLNRLYFGYHT